MCSFYVSRKQGYAVVGEVQVTSCLPGLFKTSTRFWIDLPQKACSKQMSWLCSAVVSCKPTIQKCLFYWPMYKSNPNEMVCKLHKHRKHTECLKCEKKKNTSQKKVILNLMGKGVKCRQTSSAQYYEDMLLY